MQRDSFFKNQTPFTTWEDCIHLRYPGNMIFFHQTPILKELSNWYKWEQTQPSDAKPNNISKHHKIPSKKSPSPITSQKQGRKWKKKHGEYERK